MVSIINLKTALYKKQNNEILLSGNKIDQKYARNHFYIVWCVFAKIDFFDFLTRVFFVIFTRLLRNASTATRAEA